MKEQQYLEFKNEILEVPNLKLVFLTFERSEIWQNLKNKKKRVSFQLYRGSNPDCQIHRQLSLPLYHNYLVKQFKWEIRPDCNFCQISLLSKVRKTSLRLGTFKISFLIVTNSSSIGSKIETSLCGKTRNSLSSRLINYSVNLLVKMLFSRIFAKNAWGE